MSNDETALVKKLVYVIQYAGNLIGKDEILEEALTEAQAYLEGQWKCGEGWQPIETAPKDGSECDLWANGKRWTDCIWTGKYWFTPYGIYDCGAEMELHGYYPTLWMLPTPPTTSQQGKCGEGCNISAECLAGVHVRKPKYRVRGWMETTDETQPTTSHHGEVLYRTLGELPVDKNPCVCGSKNLAYCTFTNKPRDCYLKDTTSQQGG